MGFDAEKPGTVLAQWDDGSALVKGDGSPEEAQALLQLLREQGADEETANGMAQSLLDRGLTIAKRVQSSDPRTMPGATFEAIADQFGSTS
jgi:hypothetical protein